MPHLGLDPIKLYGTTRGGKTGKGSKGTIYTLESFSLREIFGKKNGGVFGIDAFTPNDVCQVNFKESIFQIATLFECVMKSMQ